LFIICNLSLSSSTASAGEASLLTQQLEAIQAAVDVLKANQRK